jgi:hypothetical protein
MKIRALYLFCLLAISNSAFAEGNCPDGMVPIGGGGVVGCMPIEGSQNTTPTQPQGRWVTRWGAIAIGSTASGGGVGFSTNMIGKRQANKAAIAACKADGGGQTCAVKLSYYNQCAVIAWGDAQYTAQGKETIEAATKLAMSRCSKETTNCKIVYAECSLPVWVQ